MIEQKLLKINSVKLNKDNPRTFKQVDIDNISKSIIVFPEMLEGIRCIATNNKVVIGGNLRQKGLLHILDLDLDAIAYIIANHSADKSKERVEYLVSFWDKVLKTKEFNYIIADKLDPEQIKEFTIKDNVNLGAWDYDMLANDWDNNILNDWGLNVWNSESNNLSNEQLNEFFEIDTTENNSDKHSITLTYTLNDYNIVKDLLLKHGTSYESAVWNLLGLK